MTPFWHPLSALVSSELGTFVTSTMLRMLLAPGAPVELLYCGDRMWPSVSHGDRLFSEPLRDGKVRRGEVVVAAPDGIPDVLRIAARMDGDRLRLMGDADPHHAPVVPASEVLSRVCLPERRVFAAARTFHRLRLDLRESGRRMQWADEEPAAADSVRVKYDMQAPFYARRAGPGISASVLERMLGRLPRRGRVLVAGSGSGKECLGVAREGFDVTGIDFSEAMVEQARRLPVEHGEKVDFVRADLLAHREPDASFVGILFTFDVYSFIPGTAARIGLLARMARWLAPGGRILLSARRVKRPYQRAILWSQRFRAGGAVGDSHTRFIAPDGSLRRSFVHYFTTADLLAEVRRAGLVLVDWMDGHMELMQDGVPRRSPAEDGS